MSSNGENNDPRRHQTESLTAEGRSIAVEGNQLRRSMQLLVAEVASFRTVQSAALLGRIG